MAGVHVALAWLTVVATMAVLVFALVAAIRGSSARLWVDRAVLLQLVMAVGATVVGLVVAVQGPGPRDPLHFLYAFVVVAALPVARYALHRRAGRPFARWLAVAALVVMGALLRSFMTGR